MPDVDQLDELESKLTLQINFRATKQALLELRAIRAATGEWYSHIIRRLIRQEAERIREASK